MNTDSSNYHANCSVRVTQHAAAWSHDSL